MNCRVARNALGKQRLQCKCRGVFSRFKQAKKISCLSSTNIGRAETLVVLLPIINYKASKLNLPPWECIEGIIRAHKSSRENCGDLEASLSCVTWIQLNGVGREVASHDVIIATSQITIDVHDACWHRLFDLTQLPNSSHPTSRTESSNNNFQSREENLTIELRGWDWEDFYLRDLFSFSAKADSVHREAPTREVWRGFGRSSRVNWFSARTWHSSTFLIRREILRSATDWFAQLVRPTFLLNPSPMQNLKKIELK